MISHRNARAKLYRYEDRGTDGMIEAAYVLVPSTDADGAWWAAQAQPTGRENTVGLKPEHRVDAVFELDALVDGLSEDAAIVVDGVQYLVRAILPRRVGTNAVQVLAQRAGEALDLDDAGLGG